MKEALKKYRVYYVKGFIGLMERDLIELKQSKQTQYIEFVKMLAYVSKEDIHQLRQSIPKVIKALINGYEKNLF